LLPLRSLGVDGLANGLHPVDELVPVVNGVEGVVERPDGGVPSAAETPAVNRASSSLGKLRRLGDERTESLSLKSAHITEAVFMGNVRR
jgi:hypothetical protein